MKQYEAVRHYFTTANADDGSMLDVLHNYERTRRLFDLKAAAVRHGFRAFGHDDFNIAVWDGNNLISWDWMDDVVESDPDELAEIYMGLTTGDQPSVFGKV